MGQIFLDANFVIETIGLRQSEKESIKLEGHDAFLSPLTIHIMCYAFKVKISDNRIDNFISQVHVVNFSDKITKLALSGPTEDFEDNIQLHSAAQAECDYFLTNDDGLLKLKFFGKTKIVNPLSLKS